MTAYPPEGIMRTCQTCKHRQPSKATTQWRCPKCRRKNFIPRSEVPGIIAAYGRIHRVSGAFAGRNRILDYLRKNGPATADIIMDACFVPGDPDYFNNLNRGAQHRRKRQWIADELRKLKNNGILVEQYPGSIWTFSENSATKQGVKA